jgi:hypothetical protein
MRRFFALCLLALALAGCGSANGDESPGTPANTGPATTEKDKSDYGY